jgi:hypothetical protein
VQHHTEVLEMITTTNRSAEKQAIQVARKLLIEEIDSMIKQVGRLDDRYDVLEQESDTAGNEEKNTAIPTGKETSARNGATRLNADSR